MITISYDNIIQITYTYIEHLDFVNTMETDLDLTQFRQLQHDYIGYQSLTDVPRAIAYAEDVIDYSVRKLF